MEEMCTSRPRPSADLTRSGRCVLAAAGDHRCVRGGTGVPADAVHGGERRAPGADVLRWTEHDDRRLSRRLRTVRCRTHGRLLQHLLLVPRRLHSLHPVLGARVPQRSSQLRHAEGETSSTAAAAAQPPSGVSSSAGWLVIFIRAKLHYTDTGYGHVVQYHQRTSAQQVVDVQHVHSQLNLLYNILLSSCKWPKLH